MFTLTLTSFILLLLISLIIVNINDSEKFLDLAKKYIQTGIAVFVLLMVIVGGITL